MYGRGYYETFQEAYEEFMKWAALIPYGNSEKATAEGKVFSHCAKIIKELLLKDASLFASEEKQLQFIDLQKRIEGKM